MLADVEGFGRYRVTDGQPEVDPAGGRFDEWLLAYGEGRVDVLLGPEPALGAPEQVELPFAGSGWVVGGQVDRLDGRQPDWTPSPDWPLPFFRGLDGRGPALVCRSRASLVDLPSFDVTDPEARKARGWSVQNVSDVFELRSLDADGVQRTARHLSHLNQASWKVELPAGAVGLRVGRLYDRFHGRQRARVLVDGDAVGCWYDAGQDRVRRWGRSTFGVALGGGAERTIELAIDPPAGAPLWDVARYEFAALVVRG